MDCASCQYRAVIKAEFECTKASMVFRGFDPINSIDCQNCVKTIDDCPKCNCAYIHPRIDSIGCCPLEG